MSRIFDALRKSEKQLPEDVPVSPDIFIETMEKTQGGLGQVRVERARPRPENHLVVHSDPHSLGAERFRLLRARLVQCQGAKKFKTLLITSPLMQEGKSLVAANLATALASQEGCTVLLLEGDLRRPTVRSTLGLKPAPGLSESLQEGFAPLSAVRRIEPLGFFLMCAGRTPDNPVELLQSQRFADLIRSLVPHFDWILVDSPPVSPLADTLVLKTQLDASLLVVRAGATPREAVEAAVKLIGFDHIIALVLNRADGLDNSYYQYYHYASRNGPGSSKSKKEKKGPGR